MSIEEEAKTVVRQYVSAFNRGDLNALKALLSDEAEIQGVEVQESLRRSSPFGDN